MLYIQTANEKIIFLSTRRHLFFLSLIKLKIWKIYLTIFPVSSLNLILFSLYEEYNKLFL